MADLEDRLASSVGKLDGLTQEMEGLRQSLHASSLEIKQEKLYSTLFFQNLPLEYTLSAQSGRWLEEFKGRHDIRFSFHEGIHRQDIMYLHAFLTKGDSHFAYMSYMGIGWNGFQVVRTVLQSANGDVGVKGRILDFASGYGRVSRFLAGYYGPERVCVSDIKADAVDYMVERMGVSGFHSVEDPALLDVEDRFEVIFVGSLFSHLNQDLCRKWLEKLVSLTEPEGLLVFSTHDISLHKQGSDEGHVFWEQNEDGAFHFIDNQITATDKYGTSFTSEAFIEGQLHSIDPSLRYVRYPKFFGGLQDVYVVTKAGRLPAPGLRH